MRFRFASSAPSLLLLILKLNDIKNLQNVLKCRSYWYLWYLQGIITLIGFIYIEKCIIVVVVAIIVIYVGSATCAYNSNWVGISRSWITEVVSQHKSL